MPPASGNVNRKLAVNVQSGTHLFLASKWISSEEDVINVRPYLCSQRKWDVVKILPGKIVCAGKAVEVPHDSGKGVIYHTEN